MVLRVLQASGALEVFGAEQDGERLQCHLVGGCEQPRAGRLEEDQCSGCGPGPAGLRVFPILKLSRF